MPGCHRLGARDAILLIAMSEITQTNQPDPSAVREAARHLYETTPMTFEQVGKEFGVADRTVKRWAEAVGGWQKFGKELTDRAQAVADKIQTAVTSLGSQAGEDERQEVVAQLRTNAAVDQRAAVLARHRQEWAGPRALAYEAMKKRDLELARLAKTNSETLRNIQEGERRAWGLDPTAADKPSVVVIERS